jgi:hypothetical protein
VPVLECWIHPSRMSRACYTTKILHS